MAYVPFAQKIGTKYTLTNPNGATAVFNDHTDPNYCGILKEVSGFDSPEVREVADDLVQQDGGVHGDFWLGRRVITMNGIMPNVTVAQRDLMMDKIQRASMALRADATLTFQPSSLSMFIPVRRQQPLRFTGNFTKEFQLQLVSEWATMFGSVLKTLNGNGTAENQGSYYAAPSFEITNGTPTQIAVTGGVGGGTLKFTGLTLAATETVKVDTFDHSAVFTAGTRIGQSANRYIDFTGTTTWPFFGSGNNTVTLSGTGTLVTKWRDTWA